MKAVALILVAALSLSPVHAGWWKNFCERHIAVDDPYQYASAPTDWLERRAEFLEIREAWGKLRHAEHMELVIIRAELLRRYLTEVKPPPDN